MFLERWWYVLRLRSLLRRDRMDRELDDELAYHIEQTTQEYLAQGLSAREARTAALRRFGGVAQRREDCRDERRLGWLDDPRHVVTGIVTGNYFSVMGLRPGSVASPVRQVIHELDPSQPIENVLTLDRIRSDSLAPRRLNAVLIGGFALLALVIAALGVFSVLAFSVTQRTREFGIRCALGAGRREVSNTVLREGLVLTGIGLGLGGLAAAALSRSLASFLFGVSAGDPATFVVVALTFTVVAARRAARVDPMVALRAK